MPISGQRLRIAAWTSAIFLVALGGADFGLFTYLRDDADRQFSGVIERAAADLGAAVVRELAETPGDLNTATSEALKEWPVTDARSFVVFDSAGARVATRGNDSLTQRVPPMSHLPVVRRAWSIPFDAEGELRLATARPPASPPFTVVALQSTVALRASLRRLAVLLGVSAPALVLLALLGGYVLSQRALLRNRRFLAAVAHQLRTPLTVIRGETGLSLERPRDADEYREALRRVALAAEQMSRRVEDLWLLAAAESGERARRHDRIELDGLALECADLMRQRAASLGRRLELGTVEPAVVLGDEKLVREATLELIENACRHGDAEVPIRISALGNGTGARIEVMSRGAPIAARAFDGKRGAVADHPGIGLAIVRVIAELHGGRLGYRHQSGTNTLTLELKP